MLKRPNPGIKKNTIAITLVEEDTMVHNTNTRFVVNLLYGFKTKIDFSVAKWIVFTLKVILKAKRISLVISNICSSPPVVGVYVLLRRRNRI